MMGLNQKTWAHLRREQYDHNLSMFPRLREWRRNPYTFFKARFYMEGAAVLVKLLLRTRIAPNTVTLVYLALGMVGGLLLAFPNRVAIGTAAAIFFSKGILDWTDGHLARVTGRTSLAGAVLDPFGAYVGAVALQTGLGLYVAQRSGESAFYYLAFAIPVLYALRPLMYARSSLYLMGRTRRKEDDTDSAGAVEDGTDGLSLSPGLARLRTGARALVNAVNDNARTVDLVCLLLVIELFSDVFLTWIIYLGFVLRQVVIVVASMYMLAIGRWAEREVGELP